MGFLNGRVTYVRFRVGGESPLPFGEDLLETAASHVIGLHGAGEPNDGTSVGWAGGEHVLDTSLDLAKNAVNDAVHLAIRVDTDKIPGSPAPGLHQDRDRRPGQAQPQRLSDQGPAAGGEGGCQGPQAEAEAADGRFRRMAHYPVLWDGQSNVLYAGVTSLAVLDRLQTLFRETFDRILEPISAGSLACSMAEARGEGSRVEGLGPIGFIGEDGHSSVAWSDTDVARPDFRGNEFLIWLWHTLQADGDTISLPDGSDATVMLAKTLTLDCPRGETGRDQLTTEGPTRLPEAFRAIQSGKLPRKAGLIVVRHGSQYELTLQAETLGGVGCRAAEDRRGFGERL